MSPPPRSTPVLSPAGTLRLVRLLHTLVWAVFAASILAIPALAWTGRWVATSALIALVSVECLVLIANRMRCPLTDFAARYTEDRRDNFDIYLPLWLARYNKVVFGSLFAAGIIFTAILRWG